MSEAKKYTKEEMDKMENDAAERLAYMEKALPALRIRSEYATLTTNLLEQECKRHFATEALNKILQDEEIKAGMNKPKSNIIKP